MAHLVRGESIIITVRPDDAGVVALLDAFRDEAEKRGTAAVGGIGAFVVSAIVGVQAIGDKAEADEVFQAANQEANDLFDALKGYTGP